MIGRITTIGLLVLATSATGGGLKRYMAQVYLDDNGQVSIQSQRKSEWEKKRVSRIEGYQDSRFVLSKHGHREVIAYRKAKRLYPLAVSTGRKEVVVPDWILKPTEHRVFQVLRSFRAEIRYDELAQLPFIWILDDLDTVDKLPIIEEYAADGEDDPITTGFNLWHAADRERAETQVRRLRDTPNKWNFENLPAGPLFGYRKLPEVVSISAAIWTPIRPIDRDVLIGFEAEPVHLDYLRRYGFLRRDKFQF